MSRSEFPRAVKVAAWERATGRCEYLDIVFPTDGTAADQRCGRKLFPGDTFYDHIIADGLGGKPILSNCQVLCKAHHDAKTFTADVPRIAKTKRVRANHIGATKPRRPPSRFKRKLSGEVVDRTTGERVTR